MAWFSPWPPVRSGIAAYNAELVPRLADSYVLDVFVERPSQAAAESASSAVATASPRLRVLDAHDFVWRHAKHPYDLVVYQLGNETCHDYMWPYLVRYPGLVVLHDGHLHHARARALLQRKRCEDYRAEVRFDHPDVTTGVAEVGTMGLLGSLQYFWAMLRVPVMTARLVAVHSVWLARELEEAYPEARIETIRMGVSDPRAAFSSEASRQSAAAQVRARYGIPSRAVLVAAFGRLTPEKRIGPALRALAGLVARGTAVHLLLVGDPAPYYDVSAEAARHGVAGCVTVTGYVRDEELPAFLTAADLCLCLRWPSARETSASWLRCLAAGKPTVVTDLAHTVDVPALDPRDWSVLPAAFPGAAGATRASADEPASEPLAVAIDILDEDHSLALALDRLVRDARLRTRLGAAARAHFERRHTLDHMADDYRRAMTIAREQVLAAPSARARAWFPPHLLDDTSHHVAALLREIGAGVDFLGE